MNRLIRILMTIFVVLTIGAIADAVVTVAKHTAAAATIEGAA